MNFFYYFFLVFHALRPRVLHRPQQPGVFHRPRDPGPSFSTNYLTGHCKPGTVVVIGKSTKFVQRD